MSTILYDKNPNRNPTFKPITMVTLTLAFLHRQLLDIPRNHHGNPNLSLASPTTPSTFLESHFSPLTLILTLNPTLTLIYIVYILKIVCVVQTVPSKVRLKKDVFRSTPLIRSMCIKTDASLCLSLPLLQTDQSSRRTRTWSCLQLITMKLFTTVQGETTLEPFTSIVNDRTHLQVLH